MYKKKKRLRKKRIIYKKRKKTSTNVKIEKKTRRIELVFSALITISLIFLLAMLNLPEENFTGYFAFENKSEYTKFEVIQNYHQLFRGVIKEQGEVKEVNTTIVTGEKAPSEDVVSAVEIFNSLAKIAYKRLNTDLALNIRDSDQNLILIGKYSDNFLIRQYMQYEDLPDDVAKIILLKRGKYYTLILTGDSSFYIHKAALVLSNHNNFNLDSREACITGGSDKIEDIQIISCEEIIMKSKATSVSQSKAGDHELGRYTLDETWERGKHYERKCEENRCVIRLFQDERYFTINGKFEHIGNALKKNCDDSKFELCVDSDDYNVKFKKKNFDNDTIKIIKNNIPLGFKIHSLSYKINNQDVIFKYASDVNGKGKENVYEFNNIFGDDTRIEFIFSPSKLKEKLYFENRSSILNLTENMNFVDVNYKINFPSNSKIFDGDKEIDLNLSENVIEDNLVIMSNNATFILTKPYFIDDGRKDYLANLIIKNTDDLYLGIRLNADDLRNADYPIIIDPTIVLPGNKILFDGYVEFDLGSTYTRFGTDTTFFVGETEVARDRAVFEWDITSIPDGADVIDINLSILVGRVGDGNSNNITYRSMAGNSSDYPNTNVGNELFYNDMGNGTILNSTLLGTTGFRNINLSRNDSGKDLEISLDSGRGWWGVGLHTPEDGTGTTQNQISTSEDFAANRPVLTIIYDFILPTITLNNPFNNSNYTGVGNITLNSTVIDNEGVTRLIKYYGTNLTIPTGEFLLYEVRNQTNSTTTQYNWTAPVLTNTADAVLIMHFNNQSEFGENRTHIRDFSTGGNNGTVNGGIYFNHSLGKLAGAFRFTGGDATTDFVNLGDQDELIGNSMTYLMWVNATSLSGQNVLINKLTAGGVGFQISRRANVLEIYADSTTPTLMQGSFFSQNEYVHLGVTIGSDGNITLYRNGARINFTTSLGVSDNNQNFLIGSDGTSFSFVGSIDELGIFNTTYTNSQIRNSFRLPNGTYYWYVNASDRQNTTMSNINTFNLLIPVPNVTAIKIEPTTGATTAYTNDTLNCSFTVVDDDPGLSANITFINWTQAFGPRISEPTYNISVTNGTSASQLHTAQVQQKNETWWCSVVPFDGFDFGNPTNSTNITIANSPPYVPLLFQPPDGNASSKIRTSFTWSVAKDEDMDRINYTLLIDCFNRTSGNDCTTAPAGVPSRPSNDFNVTFTGNSSTNQTLSFDLIYRSDDLLLYNWTVRSFDGTNNSEFRELKRNFSIDSLVDLTFEQLSDEVGSVNCYLNGVGFGTKNPDTNDNTTDNSPNAFGIINTGNVLADVNITGTQLFSGTNPGYEFKTANYSGSGTGGCVSENSDSGLYTFNVSKTPILFIPLNTTSIMAIGSFNYTGGTDGATALNPTSLGDTVDVDINISIPSDELGGTKISTVNFTAYYRGIDLVHMP